MIRYSAILLLITLACASPKHEISVQLSANRTMGIALDELKQNGETFDDPQVADYFYDLLKESLEKSYQAQLVRLDVDPHPLQTPENIYEIASNQVDDLFIFKIEVPEGFKIPKTMDEEEIRVLERGQGPIDLGPIRVSTTIYNGERLRTVARFDWVTSLRDRERFEKDFFNNAQNVLMENFTNPNIYPIHDPLHFADLLFSFSSDAERMAEGRLTCDNAQDVLAHYAQALELYRKGRQRLQSAAHGTHGRTHEIQTRIQQSEKKANILQLCKDDRDRGFEFNLRFSGFDSASEDLIKIAVERAQIEDLSRKYTDKPVELWFSLESNEEISVLMTLRFDQERYQAWTHDRIPNVHRNYHALSLDPYHALMQRLIVMRVALPSETPRPLGIAFSRANMSLKLDTLLGGYVRFRVDGRYSQEQRNVDLFFPNSLQFEVPGFETRTLFTRSDEIFQEKGWIALGSCRTIEGRLTEDGLINQFFGIPCRL